jgi:acetyl esterase/lipase
MTRCNGYCRTSRKKLKDAGSAAEAAILFMHDGGCVLGDIETHDVLCRTLCHDTPATVFSLDYRLAPEHPFPAAVEDSVAALNWLSRKVVALGLDPERIAVAGDSAGGGLAPVAMHETKGRLAAPVRAQALIYPALDLARPVAIAEAVGSPVSDPARHDPLVLRPLFRARPAVHRCARDPLAL